MRVSETTHPRYRWRVLWREGVKRSNRFFTTEKDARAFVKEKKRDLVEVAPGDLPLDAEERRAVHEARHHGVPLMDAVQHWRRTAGAAAGRTVGTLILARHAASEKDALSDHYRQTVVMVLGRALKLLADTPAASVMPEELQAFIDAQGGHASQRLARAIMGTVFAHAIKKHWLQVNPMKGVSLAKQAHRDTIHIFTPAQAQAWLDAVAEHSPLWLAGWAIKMFAGLRDAEANRLDWKQVRLDRGLIEVTAGTAKTEARRLVDIQPNLAKILAPLAGNGPVCPRTDFWPAVCACAAYERATGQEKPLRNAARHSFVSYHVAIFGDYSLTEMQAGHSRKMLLQNYRELVTREEAQAYFAIA